MSVGTPLCDADRAPWLARIAACIDGWREQGSVVVTCSALARAYHDIVVGGCDSVRLFHLVGSRDLIGAAAPTSCRVASLSRCKAETKLGDVPLFVENRLAGVLSF